MARFMGRDYVTLKSEDIGRRNPVDGEWVSRIRLKSAIARLTRNGNTFKAVGFALTDGTPLKAIEVSVDGGPWKPATMWKENTQYSWKLFNYEWSGAQPGEHTIVSRAIDARGDDAARARPSDQAVAVGKQRPVRPQVHVVDG